MKMIINSELIEEIVINEDLKKLMRSKPFITFQGDENEKEMISTLRDETRLQVNSDGEITILGFINGILPELTGQVLVEIIDDNDNNKVLGYEIRKKWWD